MSEVEAVVVGVDGSEGSKAALRWAECEARLRNAKLRVVHAWQFPYFGDFAGMAASSGTLDELEKAARDLLDHSIEDAGLATSGSNNVEPILAQGDAASILLEAAAEANLLVVGSRGRGGFTGLILGSVSQQCAHYAHCP